ncbi:hypothetical protein MHK_002314 [Candidatus Magnetomorum sp. HK-1]|nr:hypothetical protein MHK_002314 [Candidatus Magnetomorum sp. HK-1]
MVAWYPFDGDAKDASGNGNHGTVNGASLTNDRFGNEKLCIQFKDWFLVRPLSKPSYKQGPSSEKQAT